MVPRTSRVVFRSRVSVLALAFALALAACTKDEPPKPAPAPAAPPPQAAAPQPQAAAPQPFHVTRIDLGNAIGADKKVAAPSVTFKQSDTIYASISSDGAAPAASLAVKWTFQDGQVVSESTQNIAPTGPAVTEFHIAKPDGWPAGKYQVAVVANGQPAGTLQFTVAD